MAKKGKRVQDHPFPEYVAQGPEDHELHNHLVEAAQRHGGIVVVIAVVRENGGPLLSSTWNPRYQQYAMQTQLMISKALGLMPPPHPDHPPEEGKSDDNLD